MQCLCLGNVIQKKTKEEMISCQKKIMAAISLEKVCLEKVLMAKMASLEKVLMAKMASLEKVQMVKTVSS